MCSTFEFKMHYIQWVALLTINPYVISQGIAVP